MTAHPALNAGHLRHLLSVAWGVDHAMLTADPNVQHLEGQDLA